MLDRCTPFTQLKNFKVNWFCERMNIEFKFFGKYKLLTKFEKKWAKMILALGDMVCLSSQWVMAAWRNIEKIVDRFRLLDLAQHSCNGRSGRKINRKTTSTKQWWWSSISKEFVESSMMRHSKHIRWFERLHDRRIFCRRTKWDAKGGVRRSATLPACLRRIFWTKIPQ